MRQCDKFLVTLMTSAALAGLVPPSARAEDRPQDLVQSRPGPERGTVASAPDEGSANATPSGTPSQEIVARPQTTDPAEGPTDPDAADLGEILVTAQRPRGSVIGDIPVERTFNPIDIRAYGAGTIEELLESIAPQTRSGRGREDSGPVTLLNGQRVSNFLEIAKIPTEAIERMEVFPEELALRYGYRADQKVVNIVTFERFNSRTGQANLAGPTDGGRETRGANASQFMIRGDTRFDLGADYSASDSLLESERDVQQLSGVPGTGRLRTLLPQTERLAVTGLVSGNVLKGVSSTVNGRLEAIETASLLGPGGGGALARDTDSRNLQLGTTHSGLRGRWLWNLTGNYNRASSTTFTDVLAPTAGRDTARSVNTLASADLVLAGPLLDLPAGPLSASLRGGASVRDFDSTSVRAGVEQTTGLSRDRGALQASLDLPIARAGGKGIAGLGSLSANVNLEVERLSDAGTQRTFGYGVNWSPVAAIDVIASVTHEEGAPTVEQLGGPLVVTPNVRTFDFSRREVVDIVRTFGGNRALLTDDRQVFSVGLNVKPFSRTDLALSLDYVATRIDRPIAAFPIATPQIEAAFSDRFTRDAQGRLVQIDGRPLNFARSDQAQLRSGIDFTRPLGPVPPLPPGMQSAGTRFFPSEAEVRRRLPEGTQFSVVEAGSPMARRFETMTSRLFFSLYHTWRLEDDVLLSEGGPLLDLLDGDAIDVRGGARRHELEFQAGAFKRGLGARLTVNWQSGTRVEAVGAAAGDLAFADLTTVNLSVFANLGDRFGGVNAPGWIKGTRATLGINNRFNSRQSARDDEGTTPVSYQPAYLDPLGRVISLSLRKVF